MIFTIEMNKSKIFCKIINFFNLNLFKCKSNLNSFVKNYLYIEITLYLKNKN